jgi:hypothetical protein
MNWQRIDVIYKMFAPLQNNTVHNHLSGGRRIRDCGITLSERGRAFLTPFKAILRERVLLVLPNFLFLYACLYICNLSVDVIALEDVIK